MDIGDKVDAGWRLTNGGSPQEPRCLATRWRRRESFLRRCGFDNHETGLYELTIAHFPSDVGQLDEGHKDFYLRFEIDLKF